MKQFMYSTNEGITHPDSSNMEKFWDGNHMSKNNYWLSNYSGPSILRILNISSNEVTNKTVLDIGIGAGLLCKYLHENNNRVIACDISNVALKNVESFVYRTYNCRDLKDIEPVDIATSHLVFQHCNDTEVERIIKDINLKPNGIFAFQFAFLREGEPPNNLVRKLMSNGTHHFRSLDTIRDMVERNGKKIVEVLDPVHYTGDENFSHYSVKIALAA